MAYTKLVLVLLVCILVIPIFAGKMTVKKEQEPESAEEDIASEAHGTEQLASSGDKSPVSGEEEEASPGEDKTVFQVKNCDVRSLVAVMEIGFCGPDKCSSSPNRQLSCERNGTICCLRSDCETECLDFSEELQITTAPSTTTTTTTSTTPKPTTVRKIVKKKPTTIVKPSKWLLSKNYPTEEKKTQDAKQPKDKKEMEEPTSGGEEGYLKKSAKKAAKDESSSSSSESDGGDKAGKEIDEKNESAEQPNENEIAEKPKQEAKKEERPKPENNLPDQPKKPKEEIKKEIKKEEQPSKLAPGQERNKAAAVGNNSQSNGKRIHASWPSFRLVRRRRSLRQEKDDHSADFGSSKSVEEQTTESP